MRMAVGAGLAGIGLDRAGQHAAGHRFANRFEFAHPLPPRAPLLRRAVARAC